VKSKEIGQDLGDKQHNFRLFDKKREENTGKLLKKRQNYLFNIRFP